MFLRVGIFRRDALTYARIHNARCHESDGTPRNATLVPFRWIGLNGHDVTSSCRGIQPTSKHALKRLFWTESGPPRFVSSPDYTAKFSLWGCYASFSPILRVPPIFFPLRGTSNDVQDFVVFFCFCFMSFSPSKFLNTLEHCIASTVVPNSFVSYLLLCTVNTDVQDCICLFYILLVSTYYVWDGVTSVKDVADCL